MTIRLIRESTYTRVYTVLISKHIQLKNVTLIQRANQTQDITCYTLINKDTHPMNFLTIQEIRKCKHYFTILKQQPEIVHSNHESGPYQSC